MPHTLMAGNERQEDLSGSILLARVPVYIARRRADLGVIHSALALGDFARIESVGHNLKGTGSSYGFPRITEIGGLLESAARTGSRGEISAHLKDLNNYLQSLDRQIAAASDGVGATPQSATSATEATGIAGTGENKRIVRH